MAGSEAGQAVAASGGPSPSDLARAALDQAKAYARRALSPATLRAYAHDWTHFSTWCRAAGLSPVPAAPQTVPAYLAALAPAYSRSALERRLAAIGHRHKLLGHHWILGHPAIRSTLHGIFRTHPTTHRRAAALTSAEVKKLVATCGPDLAGLRP